MFNSVNIHQYPEILEHQEQQITIGDLHANWLLLIYILIRHQILKISRENYTKLVNIHLKLFKNPYQYDWYYEATLIIYNAKIDRKPLIRLIGDELADRVGNDLLMLFILNQLQEHQVPYRIIVSNHGLCFLSKYAAMVKGKKQMHSLLATEYSKSFEVFLKYYDDGIIDLNMLKSWVSTAYISHLELFDYSLHENELTFYSHGIVGIQQLKAIAQEYQVAWQDKNIIDFSFMLEKIKKHFRSHDLNRVLLTFSETAMANRDVFVQKMQSYFQSSVYIFSNNRCFEPSKMERPIRYRDFFMKFAHGHHPEVTPPKNVISLDGQLGKHANNFRGQLQEYVCPGEDVFSYRKKNKKNTYPSFGSMLLPWVGLAACGYVIHKLQWNNHQTLVHWMEGVLDAWGKFGKPTEAFRPKLTF